MLKTLNEVLNLIDVTTEKIFVYVTSEDKQSDVGSMVASTPIEISKQHACDWANKVAAYNKGKVPCWLSGMNELILGYI